VPGQISAVKDVDVTPTSVISTRPAAVPAPTRYDVAAQPLGAGFQETVTDVPCMAYERSRGGPGTVPHPSGSIDPARDARAMEDELILADLGVVERRLERMEKDLKKNKSPELDKEKDLLLKCKAALESGQPLRALGFAGEDLRRLRGFQLLSAKPLLLVINLDDLTFLPGPLFWLAGVVGTNFGVGFIVDGIWPAFLGGLIVSVVSVPLRQGGNSVRTLRPRPKAGDIPERLCRHGIEPSAPDVIEESVHRVALGEETRLADPSNARRHAIATVAEWLKVEVRCLDALALVQGRSQIFVRESEHPAVGVTDDERLLGSEEMVRDNERAHSVVAREPAGVSDDVSVAFLEPERTSGVDARVHASENREPSSRRHRQGPLVELARIRVVGGQDFLEYRHLRLLAIRTEASKLYEVK
jgi:hypothetical protein